MGGVALINARGEIKKAKIMSYPHCARTPRTVKTKVNIIIH